MTLAGTGLETFPASIPTRAGDILGIHTQNLPNAFVSNCIYAGGASLSGTVPDPVVGDTVTLVSDPSFTFQINVSANLVPSGLPSLLYFVDSLLRPPTGSASLTFQASPPPPSAWRASAARPSRIRAVMPVR